MMTVDLTDAEIDEILGDCSCTHLTFVRMAAEIRRRREAERSEARKKIFDAINANRQDLK